MWTAGGNDMRRFEAKAVASVELSDIDTFAIVFAQELDGGGTRLEIQRALSFDEQDRKNGQDTYCLCTEGGVTHYGGVTSWVLSKDSLEIRLDAKASTVFGVEEGFAVALPRDRPARLKDDLERALVGVHLWTL